MPGTPRILSDIPLDIKDEISIIDQLTVFNDQSACFRIRSKTD